MIVPRGATFTPKQIQLDQKNNKLYWCDRERMRVTRCNLDGSEIETLIEAGRGEVDRGIQPDGAWASRSIPSVSRCIGRRKVQKMAP